MTAQRIFDIAPIGSIVAWSDGTPRPPERHKKKLDAWRANNARGRLIAMQGERKLGTMVIPAGFTLHETDLASGGVIVMKVSRCFSVASNLRFEVVERPSTGSVHVLDRPGHGRELVHLAADRRDAEAWLSRHGYPHAVLEEVSDLVVVEGEGRAA
ncbi:hypothetical protein [Pinisolibacter aquiterrae]|uniref:hypothetical protein n=1 Tax=Pinisolibacter aquiterrae TaxID=2815579 RepID=UPI001C3D5470|nr:hypothetical protein [Pinisolibacter aquiterrae]MBV5264760.1 hypothetical protein [Pinisolibacter aquiterrae]MCC8235768.1 hypothetical protein [Pinisolibacter aquiterrae]